MEMTGHKTRSVFEQLDEVVGHPVDLVTPGALKPQLRDRVLGEAVVAAGKIKNGLVLFGGTNPKRELLLPAKARSIVIPMRPRAFMGIPIPVLMRPLEFFPTIVVVATIAKQWGQGRENLAVVLAEFRRVRPSTRRRLS